MITTHQRGVSAQDCAVGVKIEPTEGSIIEIYRPEFDYLSRTLYQRWARDRLWYGVGDAAEPRDGIGHQWTEIARSGCVHVVREGWNGGDALEGTGTPHLAPGTELDCYSCHRTLIQDAELDRWVHKTTGVVSCGSATPLARA